MTNTTTFYHINDYNAVIRRGIRFFAIGSVVLFAIYLYFVGAVTFSVVHRRNMEENLKTMTSAVSGDELAYLTKEKNLTRDYALAHGMVSPAHVTFTTPKNAFAWNGN